MNRRMSNGSLDLHRLPDVHPDGVIMQFEAVNFQLKADEPNFGSFALVEIGSGYFFEWSPTSSLHDRKDIAHSVPFDQITTIIVRQLTTKTMSLRCIMNDQSRTAPFSFSMFSQLQLGHLIEFLLFKKLVEQRDPEKTWYTVRREGGSLDYQAPSELNPHLSMSLASHEFVLQKLRYHPGLKPPDPVSRSEFEDMPITKLRKAVYARGLDPAVRAEAWAVLLGVLPADLASRESRFVEHVAKYRRVQQQFALVTENQRRMRIGALHDIFQVITGDVNRNDRQLEIYRDQDSPNLVVLRMVMTAYALYNRDAGYVQGMTDIASPLVPLFITGWINPDRAVMFDGSQRSAEEAQALVFAVFCAFMEKTHQDRFFTDMAPNQRFILDCAAEIAGRFHPELAKLLSDPDLQSSSPLFRAVLLLFKRDFSFEELARLWDSFITAAMPYCFSRFVGAAFLILTFPKLLLRSHETIEDAMIIFDAALEDCDVNSLLQLTMTLIREMGRPKKRGTSKGGKNKKIFQQLPCRMDLREFRSEWFPLAA
jgi:hypothetical protein